MDQIVVSHSEADSYTLCMRRHMYAFSRGGLQSKSLSLALRRGIMGHKALEVFFTEFKKRHNFVESRWAMNQWLESQAIIPSPDFESLADCTRLCNMFVDENADRIMDWKILYVEDEFWMQLGEFVRYPFKPDLIIEENHKVVVVDWKFIYNFYSPDLIALLPQIPKYVGALKAVGIKADKGMFVQIRTRSMKPENMTPDKLIRFETVPLSPARIRQTWKEQIQVTLEIARHKSGSIEAWDNAARRTANSMVCNYCSFRSICIADLHGASTTLMRKVDYEPNTYGYNFIEDGMEIA